MKTWYIINSIFFQTLAGKGNQTMKNFKEVEL